VSLTEYLRERKKAIFSVAKAEGCPLARSAALRHPIINKNIRMGGGSEAGKAAGEGGI